MLRRVPAASQKVYELSPEDPRVRRGLYTVAGAARMVGMSASTLTSWAKGYERRFPGRPSVQQGPVITSVNAERGEGTIPFVGLVEATVVQAFRRTEFPLQRIRRALSVLAAQGELDHPLASRRLYYDGAQLLYDYAREHGDEHIMMLIAVESGQRVFHEVVHRYLRRIEFDGDEWATRLVLPITSRPLLRVVPTVADGDPLFINGGAPLSAVRSRFAAGEPLRSIAADYEVPLDDLREAMDALGRTPQAA
ncbi:MAG: hypothetical protein AB7L13_24950 [Acidimicrobiia bacterium]